MADGVVQIVVDANGTQVPVDTRTNSGGEHRQVFVLAAGDADELLGVVGTALLVSPYVPATSARSTVNASTTDVQLLPAAARRRFTVWNDSTANLFLMLGTGTASRTANTIRIEPNGYYEQDWAGPVRAVWDAAAGVARLTELS